VIPFHEAFRFTLLADLYPDDFKTCPQFLRHKQFHLSPSILSKHSIPFDKVVHEAGEIMLTFPHAYHAGYNLGFNCAESVNFALENWIEIGKRAQRCECFGDSVWIDVPALLNPRPVMDISATPAKKKRMKAQESGIKRIRLTLKNQDTSQGKKLKQVSRPTFSMSIIAAHNIRSSV
jgi:hypothetical protein